MTEPWGLLGGSMAPFLSQQPETKMREGKQAPYSSMLDKKNPLEGST